MWKDILKYSACLFVSTYRFLVFGVSYWNCYCKKWNSDIRRNSRLYDSDIEEVKNNNNISNCDYTNKLCVYPKYNHSAKRWNHNAKTWNNTSLRNKQTLGRKIGQNWSEFKYVHALLMLDMPYFDHKTFVEKRFAHCSCTLVTRATSTIVPQSVIHFHQHSLDLPN